MKTIILTTIIAAIIALFAFACGGIENSPTTDDDSNLVVSASACVGEIDVEQREGAIEAADGTTSTEPDERLCASAGMGLCCNKTTGLVSKTKKSGCDHTWFTDLASCLMEPVCAAHCNVN